MAQERIQKVLAAAGFGARRVCELLVLDGRVTVNGEKVLTLPVMVDPETDRIAVRGKPVRVQHLVYFLLNKPRHVYCTHKDPAGRKRAVDLLAGVRERVFPVGRLDADSMGLLIMTNDGDLAQRLTHPRYGIPKTYRAEVVGCPTSTTLAALRAGVRLAEGKTAPAAVRVVHRQKDKAILEITLREGRNREIRRMLAKAGHKVRRLTRIRLGTLSTRTLPLGAFRRLTRAEVRYLWSLARRVPDEGRPAGGRDGRQGPGRGDAARLGRAAPSRRRQKKVEISRERRPSAMPTAAGRGGKSTKKVVPKAAPRHRTRRRILLPRERGAPPDA